MKTSMLLAVAGSLAVAAPAIAADPAPTTPTASQQCKTIRSAVGAATFTASFGGGSNAFGKCVSQRAAKTESAAKAAKSNAAKDCKAAEAADPAAFAAKWGTKSNAYGKCVSTTAKAKTAATVKAEVKETSNAAKTCKAAKKSDAAAFATKWGKTKSAFGKCVSQTAKAAAAARA